MSGLAAAQILLLNGANINYRPASYLGQTPLMLAALNNRKELVTFLLANGADINAKNEEGWTALSRAQEFGHNEVVKILKAHGAK